jgi:cytochrome c553
MRVGNSKTGRLRVCDRGAALSAAGIPAIGLLFAALVLAGCGEPPPSQGSQAAAIPVDIAGTVHVCSSCHGPGGNSISSTFPRLAGQQKDYLIAQLTAFRDHTRADPHAQTYMWGMAARLSDPMIAALAAYYSAQPPVTGTPDNSPEAQAGRKIYTQGIASENVPACMLCHGARGQGNATIPRLAGQHSAYIGRQLEAFASKVRANEIMHENSKNLTPDQIREVAAYVRSL